MVDPQRNRLPNPDAADVDSQVTAAKDGGQGALRAGPGRTTSLILTSLREPSRHAEDRGVTQEEPDQMNDPHGTAAMALTALSSGVDVLRRREVEAMVMSRGSSCEATQKDRGTASAETPTRTMTPPALAVVGAAVAVASTMARASSSRSASSSSASVTREVQDEHRPHTAEAVSPNRERARMTPMPTEHSGDATAMVQAGTGKARVDSAAIAGSKRPRKQGFHPATAYTPPPTSAILMSTSSSSSSIFAFEKAPPDLMAIAQRLPHYVPGERMHSLSHLLKDRLSLAALKSEQGWEEIHASLSERSALLYDEEERHRARVENERSPTRQCRTDAIKQQQEGQQSYQEQLAYRQSMSSSTLRSLAGSDEQQEHGPFFYEQEARRPPEPFERSHRLREIRPFSPSTNYSASPPIDPVIVKPKRKYIKKSTMSLSMLEGSDQAEQPLAHTEQESELLHSDRGLILKTQIPKKGRPISKHSSTSQSTPTLSSFGVLPASHPYFSSKTGISSSSSLSAGQYPPVRPFNSHQPQQRSPHLSPPTNASNYSSAVVTMDEVHSHGLHLHPPTPVRRRPGRPPLASTVARHAYSQSHSSLQPGPFSASNSQLPGSSSSLSALEYEMHFRRAQPGDQGTFGRPPPPFRPQSPLSSSLTSTPRPQQIRHSYPSFQERHQPLSESQHHFATAPAEYEESVEDQYFQSPHRTGSSPSSSSGPRSFAEGIPMQVNSRKRNSYGTEKRSSTDDNYRLEDERESMSSVYDLDDQEEELYQDRFELPEGRRLRKRLSRSDLGLAGLEAHPRVESEVVQTWLEYGSERCRPRPRSLVLPRGRSDPLLTQSASSTPTSAGAPRHRAKREVEDEGMNLYERDLRDSSTHSDPHRPPPASSQVVTASTGRSLHGHARSLDFSNRPPFPLDHQHFDQPQHHQHQQRQHSGHYPHPFPSHGIVPGLRAAAVPHRQVRSASGSNLYLHHSTSTPFATTSKSAQHPGPDNTLSSSSTFSSSSDPHFPSNSLGVDYDLMDVSMTKADRRAREMSGSSYSSPSGGGGGGGGTGGRSRSGASSGQIKNPGKRSSRKGPGPYLKKHQILQQQLHQMQREQEEMEIQMALQQQQQIRQQQKQQQHHHHQQLQHLQQLQQQEQKQHQHQQHRQAVELTNSSSSSSSSNFSIRQQHHLRQLSRSLQADQEFYGQQEQQSQHHPGQQPQPQLQQQQQPQTGRPPKQRVLMRSESASSVIHSLHSPSSASTSLFQTHPHFSLSQQHQASPPYQQQPSTPTMTTAASAGVGTGAGSGAGGGGGGGGGGAQPRRRQNHHQPILLRPVSLPSLTDAGSGPSSLYYNQPPPGQPLYRSLHAPYLVSPSSLVSVASEASTSTNLSTGTGSTLVTGETYSPPPAEYLSLSRAPSPIHSPSISLSATPPSRAGVVGGGGTAAAGAGSGGVEGGGGSLHSPPYSQYELHGYHQHPYQRQPAHYRHQGGGGGTMSRSSSRGGMSSSSSGNTLVHSSSQHSLHRHSASLPALHYHLTSQEQQHHLQQQQYTPDPTRPPIHRMVSHLDVEVTKKMLASPSSSGVGTSLLPPVSHAPTLGVGGEDGIVTVDGAGADAGAGDEGPIQGLLIRTPPRDI